MNTLTKRLNKIAVKPAHIQKWWTRRRRWKTEKWSPGVTTDTWQAQSRERRRNQKEHKSYLKKPNSDHQGWRVTTGNQKRPPEPVVWHGRLAVPTSQQVSHCLSVTVSQRVCVHPMILYCVDTVLRDRRDVSSYHRPSAFRPFSV